MNRSDFVYSELAKALSTLELRPGTALSENRVARSLGVSRTPVREALRRLELEGLVEQSDGGTFLVRGLAARDVTEVCDLLEMLDGYIIRRACDRLSDEGRAEMVELAVAMTEAAEAGDITGWNEADLKFHDLIQAAADNVLVSEVVHQTRARIHRFWAAGVREERLVACSSEHRAVADAVAARDADLAQRLVVGHVEHMRTSLLDLLNHAAPLLSRSVLADSSPGQGRWS